MVALPTTRDGRPVLTLVELERYDPHPKRSGSRMRYRCPIHEGTHQNLSLDDQGHYHCHVCQASGTLKDYWDLRDPQQRPRALTFAERGQAEREYRERRAAERRREFGDDPPPEAADFLARLPAMQAALADADCPGRTYLEARGLDPDEAQRWGVGYADVGLWPGDGRRRLGRLIYPLADPYTGRVINALGRLCQDLDEAWSPEKIALFKTVKQRKLAGCASGIFPYDALSFARAHDNPLTVMEGPADVLAVLQAGILALALAGTAETVPADVFAGLPPLIIAFDDDAAGRRAAETLRLSYALGGVTSRLPEHGWVQGAKDLAALAAENGERYVRAIGALRALPYTQGAGLHT